MSTNLNDLNIELSVTLKVLNKEKTTGLEET